MAPYTAQTQESGDAHGGIAHNPHDQQESCAGNGMATSFWGEPELEQAVLRESREEFLKKVDGIIAGRSHKERTAACSATGSRRTPITRKSVCLLLERAYPLNTVRKADLVELLTSAGLEANRATQTLLDPTTKALLTLRASEGRRARQARIRDLVMSCEARRRDRQSAARATQMANEKTIEARRERLRRARGRAAGARGWLTVLKLHAAAAWLARRLNEKAEVKKKMAAAEVITRCVTNVARHRYDLRVEAATRLIDDRFAQQIRRWKTKRDTDASIVLLEFLSDVRSSNVGTRVKLLAYRVAHAHVQLARLQRWWKRTRRELSACRLVLIRLWEKEVDRRVDAKVDEVWRSRQERSLPQDNGEGPMRWAIRLHPPSSPGGSREASGSKGRAARQAREDQARSERATIRSHIILDPLINPPSDVKTRMCREYLKQMGLRHVRAVAEYVKTVNHMADVHMGTKRRIRGRGGLLAVSLAVQAGRNVMKQKGTQITQVHERPRWRTGATAPEMVALVDAGIEFVSGLLWMWKPSTPSRLKDGTFLADSMPSPEELSAKVARKFRYNGGSVMRFNDDTAAAAVADDDNRTWDMRYHMLSR
eukprot:jgi/Undpi1/10391/HiC_scaffold_29.g12841.m1